ncbi:MAG TPA: AmmeMemoRadiSam system radical SAM enzyme [Candidatus Omnitrophota bacterium]|nr:AmmeMemoRadiSam system radical SAM enzyme [Candidatus Omnitrophota bacterium]
MINKNLFFILLSLVIVFSCLPFVFSKELLHEASYYIKLDGNVVNCQLCPRRCVIPDGKRGFCRVRENQGGVLYSLVYGKPCSMHVDPIEKKPLFHVLPGARAFSIATVGCNLKCKFCQNWQISQASPEDVAGMGMSPEEVIRKAKEEGSPVIAYTYTEPTVFYEYMFDTAKLARAAGIKNVMHSAGFINEEPLRKLCPYLDAVNIDLKGFNNRFYSEMTLGNLDDVLRTLKILKDEGVWIEITNLILPGLNDDPVEIKKMCLWIKENLGEETPIHFTRFMPQYKLMYLSPTSVETLEKARRIANECGLKYVYLGNIAHTDAENTYCPKCGKLIIARAGYIITAINVVEGRCKFCEEKIEGVWK